MKSRDYSIIDGPKPSLASMGYQDGFNGLPDTSDAIEYVQAYVTGAADSARQSLTI